MFFIFVFNTKVVHDSIFITEPTEYLFQGHIFVYLKSLHSSAKDHDFRI